MSAPTGLLRITASAAFAERWLIPHLAGFRSAYPGVELDVIATDDVVDLAGAGIDLAIRLGALPESGSMVVSKLFDTSYHVVASPDYLQRHVQPETPDALPQHDGLIDADSAAWIVYLSRDYVPARQRVFMDYLKQCTP